MMVLRARRAGTGSKYVTLRSGVRRATPFFLVRSGLRVENGPRQLLLNLPLSSSRRRLVRSAVTTSTADCSRDAGYRCEIVLRMLVEILGGNSIAARCR